jgi:hypothetical protein
MRDRKDMEAILHLLPVRRSQARPLRRPGQRRPAPRRMAGRRAGHVVPLLPAGTGRRRVDDRRRCHYHRGLAFGAAFRLGGMRDAGRSAAAACFDGRDCGRARSRRPAWCGSRASSWHRGRAVSPRPDGSPRKEARFTSHLAVDAAPRPPPHRRDEASAALRRPGSPACCHAGAGRSRPERASVDPARRG